MALMPARETPERLASSSCEKPSRNRIARTSFSSIDRAPNASFLSNTTRIVPKERGWHHRTGDPDR